MINFKELACIIMGVVKSDVCRTNQLAANSGKVEVEVLSKICRAGREAGRQEFYATLTWNSFFSGISQFFFWFLWALADCMRPICIIKYNLLKAN